MKILILLFSFFVSSTVFAEEENEVILKESERQNYSEVFLRDIDFDGEDEWIALHNARGNRHYKEYKAFNIKEAKDILLNNLPKLTSLSSECVYLLEDGSTESYVGLNLREIHNDECGGDPNTDVSIGFYRIDQDKELWEMDYLDGSYQRIGE